jgi:hypothetical protein
LSEIQNQKKFKNEEMKMQMKDFFISQLLSVDNGTIDIAEHLGLLSTSHILFFFTCKRCPISHKFYRLYLNVGFEWWFKCKMFEKNCPFLF